MFLWSDMVRPVIQTCVALALQPTLPVCPLQETRSRLHWATCSARFRPRKRAASLCTPKATPPTATAAAASARSLRQPVSARRFHRPAAMASRLVRTVAGLLLSMELL